MFNFWIIFFVLTVVFSLLNLPKITTPYYWFLITEFNWIVLIVLNLLLSSYTNDPRFFVLVYFFLFVAALEVVIYILYTAMKR